MNTFLTRMALTLLLFPQLANAQSELQELRERVQRLENQQQQQTQALTEEVANLKLNLAVPELVSESFYGLGVGASKVYFSRSPLSIGGYGEIVYTNNQGGTDTTDVYRFIPYIGYRFSKNIVFNSEIEFEHGGANAGGAGKGYAVVEFAYFDFLFNDQANIRVGHVLVPVGLINLLHEPTYFPMVQRPDIERLIIPSTWHENGVLAFGEWAGLTYHAGIVTSLNAANFKQNDWVRGGRQKGAQATAEDWSSVVRLEYDNIPGFLIGSSYYYGDQSQNQAGFGSSTLSLWEAHLQYRFKGLDFSALYTQGTLSDIERIVATTGQNVGKSAAGYYAILSYDVLSAFGRQSEAALPVFVAYEDYNLHAEVAPGQTGNPSLDKTVTTFGVNYRPISNVVLKADYQIRDNKGAGENDRFELGLGWVF